MTAGRPYPEKLIGCVLALAVVAALSTVWRTLDAPDLPADFPSLAGSAATEVVYSAGAGRDPDLRRPPLVATAPATPSAGRARSRTRIERRTATPARRRPPSGPAAARPQVPPPTATPPAPAAPAAARSSAADDAKATSSSTEPARPEAALPEAVPLPVGVPLPVTVPELPPAAPSVQLPDEPVAVPSAPVPPVSLGRPIG